MKHAYGNMSECLHAWANPESIDGSVNWISCGEPVGEGPDWHGHAGNVSWQGRTVYSYGHYPIAIQIDKESQAGNGDYGPIALFQTDHYSVSTARHINEAKRCTRADLAHQWDVDHISNTQEDHRRNYAAMLERITEGMAKAERSRLYILQEVEEVERACKRANNYAWLLMAPSDRPEPHVIDPAWLGRMKEKADMRRRTAYAREEKQRAKDLAEAQKQAEKTALAELAFNKRMKWLWLLPWLPLPDGYHIQRRAVFPLGQPTPADARRTFAEWAKEWRAGGKALPYSMRSDHDTRRVAILRLAGDQVETSGGAAVPVKEAVRLWRRVMLCRTKRIEYRHGRAFNGGRDPVAIGGYQLDSISPDGDVRMGCHGFEFGELRAMALRLELVRPTLLERLTGGPPPPGKEKGHLSRWPFFDLQ